VTIRVTATLQGIDVPLAGADEETHEGRGRRTATLAGEEIELEVLQGAPPPGTELEGPAVVELAEATLLVPGGWQGQVDEGGSIHLRRG
jgi:N-methylhydantoinase A/oxoprolinase/acetone carboxylase beta subunit